MTAETGDIVEEMVTLKAADGFALRRSVRVPRRGSKAVS